MGSSYIRIRLVGIALMALLGAVTMGALLAESHIRLVGVIGALAFMTLGLIWPRLLFWVLLLVVVLLHETSYGVASGSAWTLSAYTLPRTTIGLMEILVYSLLLILAARCMLQRSAVRLPRSVEALSLALAAIVVLNVARALLAGTRFTDAFHPWGGSYILAGLAALWCFTQLLAEVRFRSQLLDVLYAAAGARACIALVQYFFGSGDIANAYAESGVSKVALWESANHLLFSFLISVALACWFLHRMDGRRRLLYLSASVPMLLTVVLSFRRTGWLGLLFALVIVTVVSLRRSQRSLIMVPMLTVVAMAMSLISSARFRGQDGMLSRFFPDVTGTATVSRQFEWQLAWQQIVRNPLFGGGPMARRLASSSVHWDTRVVHNAGLFVWLKLGLAGLLTLGALVLVIGRYAVSAVMDSSTEDHVALGVVATGPFLVIQAMFGTPLIEMRTVVLCALMGALSLAVSGAARSSCHSRSTSETQQVLATSQSAVTAPGGGNGTHLAPGHRSGS